MLARGVLASLAFLTFTLASPTPNTADGVTWSVSGPKEAVKALGAPGEALQALGKAMQAKSQTTADQPAVRVRDMADESATEADQPAIEVRETADDLLMYYNA
ncbi:hypothetical protein CcaCcLH18_10483 [Colletotrichum camelliae]|nr:hypothetical protein CcaCcLH18_10483 [Colletotrichum camelliae]